MSLTRIILSIALASLVLAGCGGGDDDTATDKQGKKEKNEKGQKKKNDPRSCENRGINVREGKTGTCLMNGKSYTVVNRRGTLELKEVAVKVGKITSDDSLSGPVGAVQADKGKTFIVVKLTVRNKLTRPANFNRDFKQTRIRVSGAAFPSGERGEGVVADSFFNQDRPIQPGKTQTGSVVFQTKSGVADALDQRGVDPVVLVWNFSEEPGKDPPSGAIRLWK